MSYKKECKGIEIDVYDVLVAFEVTNPALQHAIKKLLCPGQRGVKDAEQDLREAILSIERAIELLDNRKRPLEEGFFEEEVRKRLRDEFGL